MLQQTEIGTESIKVTSIFAQAIYVADLEQSLRFYCDLLGFTKSNSMGESGSFLALGENSRAVYLEGGHPATEPDSNRSAVSFMMCVPDVKAAFEALKSSGVQMVQSDPVDMGEGAFWFQFFDPSGNLLEIVSAP